MSLLPGLQLGQLSTPAEITSSSTYDLPAESEWRFEVAFGVSITVKLLTSTAELFGTELALNQPYTFSGIKAAIFSWSGCRIEVSGSCQVEYVAEETPMTSYINTHFALETIRQKAIPEGKDGPRVLVLGPENAGKSSLVKMLTAYATKEGRQPLVVNLDPREGILSIPGSLTASAFRTIVDVEEGWGSSPTSGPSSIPIKLPLVYYYGLSSAEENPALYKPILTRMALAVSGRLTEDPDARATGCIIDTPGVISQGKRSYDLIQHIVSEFSVNVILVLGSERLYSDLTRRFDKKTTTANEMISVVKLAKSEGCVDRDDTFMKQAREAQIREYFFGDAKKNLSPHTQQVDYSQLSLFKIHETESILNSLLPGGAEDDATRKTPIFEKVKPTAAIENSMLAIMHAGPHESPEDIRDSTVMGFVYVADVDEARQKVRVLAPVTGRLPTNAFIWGAWPEGVQGLVG